MLFLDSNQSITNLVRILTIYGFNWCIFFRQECILCRRVMMKKLLCVLVLAAFASPASADTYVKGHTKSDGTYVPGHWRSSPNSTTLDNFSTKGNVNPYTGRQGTDDPYKAPEFKPYTAPRTPSYKPYTPPCYYNCRK